MSSSWKNRPLGFISLMTSAWPLTPTDADGGRASITRWRCLADAHSTHVDRAARRTGSRSDPVDGDVYVSAIVFRQVIDDFILHGPDCGGAIVSADAAGSGSCRIS